MEGSGCEASTFSASRVSTPGVLAKLPSMAVSLDTSNMSQRHKAFKDSKCDGVMHSVRHPKGLKEATLPEQHQINVEGCPMQNLVQADGQGMKKA